METTIEKKNLIKIADIAGVSLTTASRAFSNHPYVKEATKKKILDAAHQINYEPRISVSKRNIGIVVESLEFINQDTYLSTILSYIARELSDNSLGFELIPVKELYKLEENFINTAIAILYLDESIEKLKSHKRTNFIMINNVVEGRSSVCSDHRQGIKLAYNHLKDYGHKKLAFLIDHFEGWGCTERKNSFLELLRGNDITFGENFVKNSSAGELRKSLQEIVDAGVTGIIISSENTTLRVVGEINRLGIKIPDELSVVSFENISVSQYLYPAHTTICQGFDTIVKNAVELASKSINNELKNPLKISLENSLIVRDSVKQV